jgi:hypothetical protein
MPLQVFWQEHEVLLKEQRVSLKKRGILHPLMPDIQKGRLL